MIALQCGGTTQAAVKTEPCGFADTCFNVPGKPREGRKRNENGRKSTTLELKGQQPMVTRSTYLNFGAVRRPLASTHRPDVQEEEVLRDTRAVG